MEVRVVSVSRLFIASICSTLSRLTNSITQASNKFGVSTNKVSAHLHRIGYHIRTDIFDEACTWLGYRFVNNKLVKDVGPDAASGFANVFAKYGSDLSQVASRNATAEESQRVKDAIRELFPAIPDGALKEIFETAWQKVR